MFHFRNLHQILTLLNRRTITLANVFPKLQTLKNLVRPLSKKCCFRTRFDRKHVKASQILAKSPREYFLHVSSSSSRGLIWKMSALVLSEILGVFVTTLTENAKYPVQDCDNLQLPIQMQLSQKRKTFSQFFVPLLELHQILNIFKNKIILIANVFPKLQTVKI